MRRLLPKTIVALLRSTRGATAIEYGMILALITLVIIGAMSGIAGSSTSLWSNIAAEAENAM